MLKFEETERPSFVELAKLVLTSTENTIESPKNKIGKDGKPIVTSKTVSKVFSQQNLKDKDGQEKAKEANNGGVVNPQPTNTDSNQKMQIIGHRGASAKSKNLASGGL